MKDLLADIADRCRNVRWQGADRFTSSCPNYQAHEHGDKNRSFSARATPTRILLKCHKGCSLEAICSALQIRQSYLFRDQEKPQPAGIRHGAAEGARVGQDLAGIIHRSLRKVGR